MQQGMFKLTPAGTLVRYVGQAIQSGGMVYSNPSQELLLSSGFLPMGEPVMPEYDHTTEYLIVDHYELSADGSEIIAIYTTEPLPEMPELSDNGNEDDINARITALEMENAWLVEALNMLLERVVEDEQQSVEAANTGV